MVRGRVTAIERADGRVTGVQYVDPETGMSGELAANTVILTAGAWSPLLLPEIPVTANVTIKKASILLDLSYIA